LTTPAETTAAKGTRRVRIVRVTGLRLRRRGTRELRPKAMEQETVVAMTYEVLSCLLVRGVDLFALDALIATYCQLISVWMDTLTDWLMICHRIVMTCPLAGFSIPAVTTKFVKTNDDILHGRKTAFPVSG